MVMLRNKDLDEFPWFHLFLEELFQIRENSKVWEPFLEWSSLPDSEAYRAVCYGTFPFVNVKGSLFGDPHSYGHFSPSTPDDIWVRRDSVQTYEKTSNPGIEWKTGKYLEMLILHEMVHWGRHHSGVGDDFYVGEADSGRMFAKAAYNDPYNPHLG